MCFGDSVRVVPFVLGTCLQDQKWTILCQEPSQSFQPDYNYERVNAQICLQLYSRVKANWVFDGLRSFFVCIGFRINMFYQDKCLAARGAADYSVSQLHYYLNI